MYSIQKAVSDAAEAGGGELLENTARFRECTDIGQVQRLTCPVRRRSLSSCSPISSPSMVARFRPEVTKSAIP